MPDFTDLHALKRHKLQLFGVFLATLAVGTGLVILVPEFALGQYIFPAGLGAAIIANVLSARNVMLHNQRVYQAFAQANAMQYRPQDALFHTGPGSLFGHGHSKSAAHIFSGTLDDFPYDLFHYQYTTGSGKNQQTHHVGVMSLQLPRKLPHCVIDSLVEGGVSVLPITFDRSQRIELEGDFYKYFHLYAPTNHSVSVLSMIGPDTMMALMEHAARCDIEIIDDRLYFYWPFRPKTQADYEDRFVTVHAVLKEIGQKLRHTNFEANKELSARVASYDKTYDPNGSRLKANALAWQAGLIIAAIAFGFAFQLAPEPIESTYFGIFMAVAVTIGIAAAVFHHIRVVQRRKELAQRFGKRQSVR